MKGLSCLVGHAETRISGIDWENDQWWTPAKSAYYLPVLLITNGNEEEITLKEDISELKIEEPFKSLFMVNERILESIQEDMGKNGYDESKPITIWKEKRIVIDGHVRLQAAKNVGLTEVPVVEHDFDNEEAAFEYAIHNQRDRRNLNDANILYFVEKYDEIFPRGGDRRSKIGNPKLEKKDKEDSRDITAKRLGISADKVSQCRYVLKNCTDSEKKDILDGKKSIHQVWKSSSDAAKNQENKEKKQELHQKRIQELKFRDIPDKTSKDDKERYKMTRKNLTTFADKLIPKLEKRSSDISKVKEIIEYFKSDDETFKDFREQVPVQNFLCSQLVTDFIEILSSFGYEVKKTHTEDVIMEEKAVPVMNEMPVTKPHVNIVRRQEAAL